MQASKIKTNLLSRSDSMSLIRYHVHTYEVWLCKLGFVDAIMVAQSYGNRVAVSVEAVCHSKLTTPDGLWFSSVIPIFVTLISGDTTRNRHPQSLGKCTNTHADYPAIEIVSRWRKDQRWDILPKYNANVNYEYGDWYAYKSLHVQ